MRKPQKLTYLQGKMTCFFRNFSRLLQHPLPADTEDRSDVTGTIS